MHGKVFDRFERKFFKSNQMNIVPLARKILNPSIRIDNFIRQKANPHILSP